MPELKTASYDRRVAGRRLHFDGQDWAVLYTDVAARRPLAGARLDWVLQALRVGTLIVQTDPEVIAEQPAPVSRRRAMREWLLLDAAIAGARAHRTLAHDGRDVLEGRLASLADFLRRHPLDTAAVATSAAVRASRRPGETRILLVEGSAALRLLVMDILTESGYLVWSTNGVRDAQAVLALVRQPFDLVLTAVALLGGSGPEFVAEIRRATPDVRVLYLSTSTHETLLAHGIHLQGDGLLPLPCAPAHLLTRVAECLSAGADSM
jgi:CheY-like chemotaxis protein